MKSQRITISKTRKFISCNFSMDQLNLISFGGEIYPLIHNCPTSINGKLINSDGVTVISKIITQPVNTL